MRAERLYEAFRVTVSVVDSAKFGQCLQLARGVAVVPRCARGLKPDQAALTAEEGRLEPLVLLALQKAETRAVLDDCS